MATGQKKNRGATKSTARKKTAAGKAKTKTNASVHKKSSQEVYYDGIIMLIVAAVMLFVICCNFGFCGIIGKGIRIVTFGLFGAVQYILPFAICIAVVMAIYYDCSGWIMRKITLSAVFMIFLCTVFHMTRHIDWGFQQLAQTFQESSTQCVGGGLFGGLITGLFYPVLAASGTWILVVLVLLILFVLIIGTNIIELVRMIISWYSMDEEEMVAREALRNQKMARRNARQQVRKDERKQRYEKATTKEQQELQEIENRRMQLQQQNGQRNINEIVFDVRKIKEMQNNKENGQPRSNPKVKSGTAKKKVNRSQGDISVAMQPKEEPQVKIDRNGELRITGLVNEDQKDMKKSMPGQSISQSIAEQGMNSDKIHIPGTYQGQVAEKPQVRKVTAQFVTENETVKDDVTKEVVQSGKTQPENNAIDTVETKVSHRRTKETAAETMAETAKTAREIKQNETKSNMQYKKPILELLSRGKRSQGNSKAELQTTAKKLEDTLESFGVHVTVTDVSCGPAVTRYEMLPEQGTRVSKITGLADDIKLNLAVADIRIEAPIPGKAAIGIEVPNKEAAAVAFRDLLEDSDFMQKESDLSFAVGKDIGGQVVISDIGKMPHVLIAGATGSGKSVCINTLIMSLLYKADPNDVKLIMIDPKVVELSVYNGIPHLLIPVVTDPKKASGALNWAVAEMEARYKKFAEHNVRNLEGYNKKVEQLLTKGESSEEELAKMPKIVIIVDELADLMMVAHGEVEDAIVRLSQLARAAGIHLVIATQRPSVDVITGLIKANVPSRIAFAVSSGVDSRTILDMNGAEKLLGKGDMLFAPSGYPKPVRVQGAFVSDKEVSKVVEFLKAQDLNVKYNDNITREINCGPQSVRDANKEQDRDEYFVDAGKFIIEKDKASIGMLQRVYKIGFNRAARIMDQLCEAGVVGPEEGTKPRQIIMSMEEFENMLDQGL